MQIHVHTWYIFPYDNVNIINGNAWNTYLKQGQLMKTLMDMHFFKW